MQRRRRFCGRRAAVAALTFLCAAPQIAAAQIRIEIPRIGRPKAEAPKPPAPPAGPNTPAGAPASAAPSARADDSAQKQRRSAFHDEVGEYFYSVRRVAALHDPKFHDNTVGAPGPEAEPEWVKIRKDLAAVDELCRARYAGVTDSPDSSSLRLQVATVCLIAARRADLEKLAKADIIARNFKSLTEALVLKDIVDARNDSWGYVSAKVERMLFEREGWRREMAAQWAPKFAQAGVEMPADLFAPFEQKLDELKAHIEQTAPSRKWEQPGNSDPAAEALVKQRIAAELKGAQILKIGTSYNGWRMHKNSLGIPTNQFKRGWVLLKVPNRPHCQAREWLLKQEYAGGGRWSATKYGGLGAAIFMPCN